MCELTKELVHHAIGNELLQKPGDSITFTYQDWILDMVREEELYAPFLFGLTGTRRGTNEEIARRYIGMEQAFLAVFNLFNENAAIKKRYASLKEALESKA